MLEGTNAVGLNEKKKELLAKPHPLRGGTRVTHLIHGLWLLKVKQEGKKGGKKQAGGVAQAGAVGSGLV